MQKFVSNFFHKSYWEKCTLFFFFVINVNSLKIHRIIACPWILRTQCIITFSRKTFNKLSNIKTRKHLKTFHLCDTYKNIIVFLYIESTIHKSMYSYAHVQHNQITVYKIILSFTHTISMLHHRIHRINKPSSSFYKYRSFFYLKTLYDNRTSTRYIHIVSFWCVH